MVQLSTPGVTPNRGMGPPWGAFCQITLTSCLNSYIITRSCQRLLRFTPTTQTPTFWSAFAIPTTRQPPLFLGEVIVFPFFLKPWISNRNHIAHAALRICSKVWYIWRSSKLIYAPPFCAFIEIHTAMWRLVSLKFGFETGSLGLGFGCVWRWARL